MRKKHSGEIVSEKKLEIPIDSFKEKLELCRYNWKLWIDRDHIDKKTGLHNSWNTFSLSNSVPGRSSAFMFELFPNYRGLSRKQVIPSVMLLVALTPSC